MRTDGEDGEVVVVDEDDDDDDELDRDESAEWKVDEDPEEEVEVVVEVVDEAELSSSSSSRAPLLRAPGDEELAEFGLAADLADGLLNAEVGEARGTSKRIFPRYPGKTEGGGDGVNSL